MNQLRPDLELPSYDDYDVLRECFLALADTPDTQVVSIPAELKLYLKSERTFVDLDFLVLPPLTICLSGILRTVPGGERMLLRYRELAHHPATENSSLNHDYIFEAVDGELIEFGQSIRACPQIPECRQEISTNTYMDQVNAGTKILMTDLGNQLEVASGDCGVLFDRMMLLYASSPS